MFNGKGISIYNEFKLEFLQSNYKIYIPIIQSTS